MINNSFVWQALAALLLTFGCSGGVADGSEDAGRDDARTRRDAGNVDAPGIDAPGIDAPGTDSGPRTDVGPRDTGPLRPPVGTDGCGTDSPTGTFTQSVEVAGRERTFFVSVPESYDPDREYPLVFGYHGGDDFGGEAMRGYLNLESVEPVGSEIFVYPDATAVNHADGTGFEYGIGPAAMADDAFFDSIVEIMSGNYCIDTNRVFVTGQSAGGGYVVQLACHRGNVIRAAVPVAANLVLCGGGSCVGWGDTHPSLCVGNAHVMQMHSPDDWIELNPFGLGTLEFMASAAGCGPWTDERVMISDFDRAETDPVDPAPCVQRRGCDRDIIFCPYRGGHQIPSWYPESGMNYEETTMNFFRSY